MPPTKPKTTPVIRAETPTLIDSKPVHIGTAGWTVRKDPPPIFLGEGSHLERYARGLNCVEINSTFYREHMPRTWLKWSNMVPTNFRFAVKAPRAITHEGKLRKTGAGILRFVEQVNGLGDKLGPLLFQLPPKLAFEQAVAEDFLEVLREVHAGSAVLEPRHASWFTPEAAGLLRRYQVARVAADPARVPEAARPGGWPGLLYYRLHGSPRIYYSGYEPPYLDALAQEIAAARQSAPGSPNQVWCIFDNTALGAAIFDARRVFEALAPA